MQMETDSPPTFNGGGDSDATLAVSGLVIGLAAISCGLRFYTRIFTRQGLRWDDWLIFSAVVFTLLAAALLLWGNAADPNGSQVSQNRDTRYVYTDADILYLKLSFISSVIYFAIAGTTKLGILFMYNRIFWVSKGFRTQLYVVSGLVIGWWVGCTIASLTNCIPLEYTWINSFADPRYCLDFNVFWMASGACEILLDFLILTLPIQAVVRMTLSLRRKITIGGIFLMGGFVIITGLVKVILGYPPNSRSPSYENTEVWATVHAGMAIVCSSLPIFRPLVSKISSWSRRSISSRVSSVRAAGHSRSISWSVVRGTLQHITGNDTVNETQAWGSSATAAGDGSRSQPEALSVKVSRDNTEDRPHVQHAPVGLSPPALHEVEKAKPGEAQGEGQGEVIQPEGTEKSEPSLVQQVESAGGSGDDFDSEAPHGPSLRPNDSMV